MGTRAIYTFEDNKRDLPEDARHMAESIDVYKHYDGYPQGASGFIENALDFAWQLPRFEADEFAAAFVAANKDKNGGGIHLTNHADSYDVDWRYYITFAKNSGRLMVTAYERDYDETRDSLHIGDFHFFDRGTFTLEDFSKWANQ